MSPRSIAFLSLPLLAFAAWCQAPDNRARRGVYPGGTFAIGDFESINGSNGNVFIRFPLAGLQPAPSGMGAGFALTYSSFIYDTYQSQTTGQSGNKIFENRLQFSQFGGWQYGYEYGLHLEVRPAIDGVINCQDDVNEPWKNQKLSLRLPDGSLKTLRLRGFQDYGGTGYYAVTPTGLLHNCLGGGRIAGVPGALHYYTSDGSFIRVTLTASGDPPNPPNDWATQTWTVYLPDGTTVIGKAAQTEKIEDRFGAKVLVQNLTCPSDSPSACQPGSLITRLVDDFGRFVELERTTTTQHYVHAQTFNAEWIHWTINRALVSTGLKTWICTSEGASCSETFSIDSVMSVTIPAAEAGGSGQVYSFAYSRPGAGNGWGELREAVTPTGHKTTYSYVNDGGGLPNVLAKNPVLSKTITFDAKENGATVAQTETWAYSFTPESSTITNPEGGFTQNSFFSEDIPTNPQRGLVYRTRNPDGSVVEKLWLRNKPWSNPANDAANPYVRAEFRSLPSVGGGLTDTAIRSFTYDKNGNLRTTTDHQAVPYTTIARGTSETGPPTAIPAAATALRITTNLFFANVNETPVAGDGSESVADNTLAYWNPAAPRYRAAVRRTEANGEAITEFDYGSTPTTRGLVATERRWASRKSALNATLDDSNSVKTTFEYSSRGNRTKVTQHSSPLSTVTEDIYGDITLPGGGTASDLFLTERREASGTTEQIVHKFITDFSTGLVKTAEISVNAQGDTVATNTTYDRWGRPKTVTEQLSDTENRVTTTVYDDVLRCVKTEVTLGTSGSLQTFAHYDPVDRVRLVRTIESGTGNCSNELLGIKTETRYRRTAGYSYVATSNPFRANRAGEATTEETMGWTLETQDAGGRPKETGYFSGADAPSPFNANSTKTGFLASTYDNRSTKVVDAKDRETTYTRDILGRTSQVDERKTSTSVETTTYTYDARDNLIGVVQGTQTRTFEYESLGRLWRSNNPEGGIVTVVYDDKGNPTTRTDGRFTTTMTYNVRNQMRTKSFSDPATPPVTYNYDGTATAYSLGRLTSVVSDNATFRITEYDRAGRVKKSEQQTAGTTYAFEYTYHHSGALASVKYPSGRTVTYGIDAVGRTSLLAAGATTYATDFTYAAHGALKTLRQGNGASGNGLYETYRYNPRLQMTELRLGTTQDGTDRMQLVYTYGNTDNNGTVRSISTYPVGQTQTYTYDRLQRLKSFTEGTLQRTYDYDRWANQWVVETQSSGIPIHPQTPKDAGWFSAGNNRMTGVAYDAAGNQTSFGPYTLAYTAENQLRTVDSILNGSAIYAYDGNGRRVLAIRCATPLAGCSAAATGAVVTNFVYDASGALMAEYGNDPPTPGTRYLAVDALGSTRLTTDGVGGDVRRFDYWPFGESIATGTNGRTAALGYGSGAPRQQFTGQERDSETGLDYFNARYLSSTQGRFTSPDPQFGRAEDPQSWNMFSYGRNDPLRYVDPTGEKYRVCDWEGKNCSEPISDEDFNKFRRESSLRFEGGNKGSIYSGKTLSGTFVQTEIDISDTETAAQKAVTDAVLAFVGYGPKRLQYGPNDPFTKSFENSIGMDAIRSRVMKDCTQQTGKLAVGTGEAFVNALIDGVIGGRGFHNPNAQLGAFNASFQRSGGVLNVTVTNPISLNSAAYHVTSKLGIANPTSGPFGTVHQTMRIQSADPCAAQ